VWKGHREEPMMRPAPFQPKIEDSLEPRLVLDGAAELIGQDLASISAETGCLLGGLAGHAERRLAHYRRGFRQTELRPPLVTTSAYIGSSLVSRCMINLKRSASNACIIT